ncbi:MAG: ribonuclease P protein component [Bacteroidales bacterium]|nr:ribonuclease P protein component [Bacteroidales bacterium]
MNRSFTFRKAERLSHRTQIDNLFHEGLSFNLPSFKVIYLTQASLTDVPVKVLMTVSKKKFKRSVDRNRIRRLMREAYRLHKHILTDKLVAIPGCLHMALIYVGDRKDIGFEETEQQMIRCLERLGGIVGSST